MSIAPNVLVPILLVCYVAWRVYVRMRKQIGKQLLRARQLTVRLVIYCVIVLIVSVAALRAPLSLAGIGGGLVLGAVLGLIGLRLTSFETTPEGQYYTPNTAIGVGLTLLFVGRLAYRITVLYGASRQVGPWPASFGQSPLTLLILGLLFGYYIAYYAGILIRDNRQNPVRVS